MKTMKNIFLLIGVIVFFSCEEEIPFERITFTDIQPDKSLTTYGINSLNLYDNNIRVAVEKEWINDSIFTYALSKTPLDFNKDGIEDFTIEIEHQLTDTTEYIYNDQFVIHFKSKNSNQVSIANEELGYIKNYEYGQMIDTSTFRINSSNLESYPGGFIIKKDKDVDFQLLGDYYVAIKILADNKPYYGWIHIKVDFFKLTLYEYAISNEPNTLLSIGQTK